MKLIIRTPYGETYFINEKGEIAYPGNLTPSGNWKLLGLVHVKRTSFYSLDDLLNGVFPSPLLYKNGNPQWTVVDLDHGTRRQWGNTKYHGVKTITLEK